MSDVALRVSVPERQLARFRALSNIKGRFKSVRDTPQAPDRFALWARAVELIGAEAPITLLEFGVFEGRSTRFWAERFKAPDTRIHGFDSFEGLPEDWSGKMVQGTFSTEGAAPDIADPRVAFHRGWIQNTLPPFLKSERFDPAHKLVVHIDVDLYSAALFVMTTLWHYVDEYFVIFDEFGVDENLALADFIAAYPVELEFFGHTFSKQFNLPQQVFGRVRNVEYAAKPDAEADEPGDD